MMLQGFHIVFNPPEGLLAQFVMSEDNNNFSSMKSEWNPGSRTAGEKPAFFTPDELDIYCNKVTNDTYIFHGKDIDYSAIDHIEYFAKDYSVDVVMKDGRVYDLGVKIQWLVRPYFSKAHQVHIVKTVNNKSVDGTVVPLIHKQK
jgi:hypothetical protein